MVEDLLLSFYEKFLLNIRFYISCGANQERCGQFTHVNCVNLVTCEQGCIYQIYKYIAMMISHSDYPMRRKVGDMAKDKHGNKVFWNNIFALCEDLSLLRILQIGLIKELISQ